MPRATAAACPEAMDAKATRCLWRRVLAQAFLDATYAKPTADCKNGGYGSSPVESEQRQARAWLTGHVAGWAGVAATVSGTLASVAPALPVIEWMRDRAGLALIIVGVAVLFGVGRMLWARIDDRRLGLR